MLLYDIQMHLWTSIGTRTNYMHTQLQYIQYLVLYLSIVQEKEGNYLEFCGVANSEQNKRVLSAHTAYEYNQTTYEYCKHILASRNTK